MKFWNVWIETPYLHWKEVRLILQEDNLNLRNQACRIFENKSDRWDLIGRSDVGDYGVDIVEAAEDSRGCILLEKVLKKAAEERLSEMVS